MKRILSISGGGIRGIIPVCFLAELERQTGWPALTFFDFVAGTSTGACLVALLEAKVPMTQALSLYSGKTADKVFSPSGFLATAKRIANGYQYEPANLAEALRAALGEHDAWTINDCPAKVLITSVDAAGHTWFFVRDNALNSSLTGTIDLVDAAVASSCAPTYHAPWPVVIKDERLWMFDGGTSCYANPTHQACIEAFEYDIFTPADTQVISLGTGYFPGATDPPHGLLETIGWAVGTLVDSSEDLADQNARREYFRSIPDHYLKINPLLPRDIAEDDLSAIPDLISLARFAARKMDWAMALDL